MKIKQFVLRISLLLVLGLLIYGGALYFGVQDKTGDAAFAAPGTLTPTPASDEISQILQTSDELTIKWAEQVTTEEWLYISYIDEVNTDVALGVGDDAIDPETGWPLPTRALWEKWYKLDDKGQQFISIIQRTDLDRGNVTQVIWQDGNLLRLPSGVRENTFVPGRRVWEIYRPIWDHVCNKKLQYSISQPQDDVSIKADWVTNDVGKEQWALTMTLYYPPVSDAYKGVTAIANQSVCYRNAETGAVEYINSYVISDTGELVLVDRTYNYMAIPLKEPPADVLALLEMLNEAPQQP